MRNFNELIGIIRGINFDCVINDKEVMRLQSWVNRNRNLAYEPRQVELIKLVDTVLEDKIITETECETMLMFCDKFLNDISDETSKIYEMNGIIEGIVCDGEVNEAEVYRLKDWMDHYGDSIRGNKPSEALCRIIDNVLADGVVTEGEQEQLLQLLTERISGSQFEIKIEYLKKQVKAKRNIGLDLIDLLDNEDAMDTIHKRAELELKRVLNSYSGSCLSDQEIIFISLVLIAMIHYDGNYYENVRTTYKDLYSRCSEQKVEGLIRTVLNRYRLNEDGQSGRSRIINVALSNAIVPSYYLSSFFEFIYDIYKLNFEYSLSDDLFEDFKFVYEGLSSNMLSEGDDLQVNVTKKSYKLIKSTKQLISNQKHIDAVIKLSIIIANIIDKKTWDKDISIFNPYLKQGYEGWIETLKKGEKGSVRQRTKSEFRSRWEPKYMLLQNSIYIVPPVHRVKSQYNYRNIMVVVKNRDQVIYKNKHLDIREIIGGYQVSINKIEISNPLGEIKYQLLAGDEVIYDSKDRMYRPYIVFGQEGSEIQNNTDYSGTAAFCLNKDVRGLRTYHKAAEYVLASQNVRLGEAFVIEDTIFNFSSLFKPGIFGDEWESYFISPAGSDEKLTVFQNVKFLVFESNITTTRFEIVVDDRPRKLDDFDYSITERDGVNKYVISLSSIDNGIHFIEVNAFENGKKNRILSLDFALDEKLCAETVKMNGETYFVSVASGLFLSSVIEEIKIDDFQEDWLKFSYAGIEYIYLIPFVLDIYRMNGESWHPIDEEICVGDISQDSILELYGTSFDEIQIHSNSGEMLEETIKLKGKGIVQQLHVGFLASYKVSYDYTVLWLLKDGIVKNVLYCYNKCILDEERTELTFDPVQKRLDITPMFHGKGRVYFSITDHTGEEVFRSGNLKKGVLEAVTNLTSFEKYTITFYEKEKGLSLKKERVLKEYEQIFYAREDFVGRSFKIKEVQFDQYVRGEFLRKNHYFNTTYLYFLEKLSDDEFIGELYVRTYNGPYMLNRINPVSIEICSDIIEGAMELAITKDGDGLLLDFEHHCVMNNIDDDSAVDIFSYTMDMNGVKAF